MTALRVLVGAAAAGAAGAIMLVDEPEVFRFSVAAGLVMFVVGAGAVAADALPYRSLRFATSLVGCLCGPLLITRGLGLPLPPLALALAALIAQPLPWLAERRRRPGDKLAR